MMSSQSADETEDTTRTSLVDRLFSNFADDPKGSVHRAWGLCLLFLILQIIVAVIELINLRQGSKSLLLAVIWSGLLHLVLAVLGTFILRRFSTLFALGFLLGFLLVVTNQNLILFCCFQDRMFGSPVNPKTNRAFSIVALILVIVLTFFTTLLARFRQDLAMAAVDVKGLGRRSGEEDWSSYSEQQ
uniref:Uncharacterized protein n=1 Tax=Cyclophora tenuis TaxID=216820 RepID=A0A7S1CYB0_CYCTE|mmetsp:Transcript_14721/g.24948  ORF Transcript_14721/g.24948 Transcript_14721/m.24948 type:complete len:187 (+) Transcript_14721:17-577(+)